MDAPSHGADLALAARLSPARRAFAAAGCVRGGVIGLGAGGKLPGDELELDLQLSDHVRRMVGGDQQALEALYDSTLGRVYGLALRIVGRREVAEEVTEDTFFQAWRRAADYDPARGRVLAWLLTICRSRALDALRRTDPAELHEDVAELLEQSGCDGTGDPQRRLAAMRLGSAVREALAMLKPQARQMVALAFFRGLTHQEIADSHRIPLGTVKATLHRAYGQLRAFLDGREMEAIDE